MTTLHSLLDSIPAHRLRYLLIALFAGIVMVLLSACGELSSTTDVKADGSGTQTFSVRIDSSDLESIDGGVTSIEKIVNDKNPGGFTWEGSTKDGDDVTTVKVSLAFDSPEDYQKKAAAALEAAGITETPEVVFTEPTPPFSTGYTFARSFSDEEMIRWVSKALIDDGKVENEDDPSNLIRQDKTTVKVDGEELDTTYLESDPSTTAWSNAETLTFAGVDVVTTGFHDASADQFQRTITYTLDRETYRKASDDFDAFFEAAVPDGGELKPAADSENTWTVTFPAGSAEQVAAWTDTALADEGAQLSVSEAAQGENPLQFTTNIVSDIPCTIACRDGAVRQQIAAGEDPAQLEEIPVSPEPYQVTRSVTLTGAEMEIEVDREGGGTLEADYSLSEADDALVTEEKITQLLGGEVEREASDGTVTYTVTVKGADQNEFSGALGSAGFMMPETGGITVVEAGHERGLYYVGVYLQHPDALSGHLPESTSWTVTGDGLAAERITGDETGTAAVEDDDVTVTTTGDSGMFVEFSAERSGLGIVGTIAIILGGVILLALIAAAVLAYVFRSKLKALVGGSSDSNAQEASAAVGGSAEGDAAAGAGSPAENASAESAPSAPETPSAPEAPSAAEAPSDPSAPEAPEGPGVDPRQG